jgi:hypothetical protein
MSMFLTLASTAAPVGAALIYDRFHTYDPVVAIAIVLALIATGIIALSRPNRKKQSVPYQPDAS